MLSEFHDPQAFETWLKSYCIILKMNETREDKAVFSFPGKLRFCRYVALSLRYITVYMCLAAILIPIANEIISLYYEKNPNI